MSNLTKLVCNPYAFYFSEGWEAIWHPHKPLKPRGVFTVTIKHNHERGGDSVSYQYTGPASLNSSFHLIKRAIKDESIKNKTGDSVS